MEPVGLGVAPSESVSEWRVKVKTWEVTCTTADYRNTVHLGYTQLIKNFPSSIINQTQLTNFFTF